MDTMALLCNLHADGPATLHALQRIGCRKVSELESVELAELADVLHADEVFARMFVREAKSLELRFDPNASGRGTAAESRPEPAVAPPPPAMAQTPGDTVLVPGLIEGLDADWCHALVGEGVRTLEGLVEAPGLPLARRLRRPYTRLADLQLLAQRRVRGERDGAQPRSFTMIPASPRPKPHATLPGRPHGAFGGEVSESPDPPGVAGPFT